MHRILSTHLPVDGKITTAGITPAVVLPPLPLDDETLMSWMDARDLMDDSRITYRKCINHFRRYLHSAQLVSPLPADITNFVKYLRTYKFPLTGKGLSPTSIAQIFYVVKAYLTWLSDSGIYPNVCSQINVKMPPFVPRGHGLTPTNIRDILATYNRDTLQGKRDYAIILLMATCGLRRKEIWLANHGDIKLIDGHHVLYIAGKGHRSKDTYVKLAPATYNAIMDYRDKLNELRAFAPFSTDEDAPLFIVLASNTIGRRVSRTTITSIASDAFKAVGLKIKGVAAHALRHFAVNTALRLGHTIDDVSRYVRHTDISTTMIYKQQQEIINCVIADDIEDCILATKKSK